MARPERPKIEGVTKENARRIVALAKLHGLQHVHPLLTDPKVTSKTGWRLVDAAEGHGVKITPEGEGPAHAESIRKEFRRLVDLGLLPEDYPHTLTKEDRGILARLMRAHGVGPVQQALEMHRRPSHHDFEGMVIGFKTAPGRADRLD